MPIVCEDRLALACASDISHRAHLLGLPLVLQDVGPYRVQVLRVSLQERGVFAIAVGLGYLSSRRPEWRERRYRPSVLASN